MTNSASVCYMRVIISIVQLLFISNQLWAQQTYVPDDQFEQALINLGVDVGPLNDSVPTANISPVTELTINGLGISDLTGIEDFNSLQRLSCAGNNLDSLGFPANLNLEVLLINSNSTKFLDVTFNINLVALDCSDNLLEALDLSNNMNLQELNIRMNNLMTLDVADLTQLEILDCGNNGLAGLDIRNNRLLREIYCQDNILTDWPLGLGDKDSLIHFRIDDNMIGGCWPTYMYKLCSQIVTFNFEDNLDDGINDFISNTGFADYCQMGRGRCCELSIVLDCEDPFCLLPAGWYASASSISVSGNFEVESMESVILDFSTELELLNGFSVKAGSTLDITPGNCVN